MQTLIIRKLLLVAIVFIITIGVSCSKKHEVSMFLIEGNITGLDIDIIFGGYDPSLVEENLVIPTIKHIAKNKDIDSIKYQISPTYFRIFIKTANSQNDALIYNQLMDLVEELPNAHDSLNNPEGIKDDRKIYIATDNFNAFKKGQYYISGKPLVLPIANTIESKISIRIPDMRAKQLTIRIRRDRLDAHNIDFHDLSDIVTAKYLKLSGNDSLLLTDIENLKDLPLSTVPNANGQYILLRDIAHLEYLIAGIDRPWTPVKEFR